MAKHGIRLRFRFWLWMSRHSPWPFWTGAFHEPGLMRPSKLGLVVGILLGLVPLRRQPAPELPVRFAKHEPPPVVTPDNTPGLKGYRSPRR